jgi:conjugative transposon TraN protein
MKKISVLVGMWLMLLTGHLFAQGANIEMKDPQIPLVFWLSFTKTSNFIFPYAIKSVDKGSKDVLVQKANGVENVLQVKAAKLGFTDTNLTVITADGQLYSFILKYSDQPPMLNIRFESKNMDKPVVQFSAEKDNDALMNQTAEKVAVKFRSINNIKDSKFSIAMRLTGIYIENDLYYFQLQLENNSNVNYAIDQLRFFIHDQKKSKRTASQEVELTPVQILGNNKVINSKSKQTLVVAIHKFTIPDKKELLVQLQETNGGRHLVMKVENRNLIKASFL